MEAESSCSSSLLDSEAPFKFDLADSNSDTRLLWRPWSSWPCSLSLLDIEISLLLRAASDLIFETNGWSLDGLACFLRVTNSFHALLACQARVGLRGSGFGGRKMASCRKISTQIPSRCELYGQFYLQIAFILLKGWCKGT
jgi:hypothetical protein